jgi:hypothetical protein
MTRVKSAGDEIRIEDDKSIVSPRKDSGNYFAYEG